MEYLKPISALLLDWLPVLITVLVGIMVVWGAYRVLILGMLDRASGLALRTSYAPLRIHEDGFHLLLSLVGARRRIVVALNPCKKQALQNPRIPFRFPSRNAHLVRFVESGRRDFARKLALLVVVLALTHCTQSRADRGDVPSSDTWIFRRSSDEQRMRESVRSHTPAPQGHGKKLHTH